MLGRPTDARWRGLVKWWRRPPAHRRRRSRTGPVAAEVLEERTLLSGVAVDLSVDAPVDLNGVGTVEAADVVRLAADQFHADDPVFELLFDGSDVGLSGANVDAFAVLDDGDLLLSFSETVTVDGVEYAREDVVRFTPTSLGEETAGEFSTYFDGSAFGLHLGGRAGNVDALDVLEDGSLVVSTEGNAVVVGTDGTVLYPGDADLIRITPGPDDDFSVATVSILATESQLDLTFSNEDVDGLSLGGDGEVFVSTLRGFSVDTFGGGGEDVLQYDPTTGGGFEAVRLLDLGDVDAALIPANVDALEVTLVENAPPTAGDLDVVLREDGTANVQLLGDDGDPDDIPAGTLEFEIVSDPAHGTVTLDADTGELVYAPDADFNGEDRLEYRVVETTAEGEVLVSESATVSFTVEAVNDAPVVTVGDALVGQEDVALAVTGITVFDVDAGDAPLEVALDVVSGTLTVSPDVASNVVIDGNGTGRLVLRGAQGALNELLGTLTYLGNLDFDGEDRVAVTVSDLGNTGLGGELVAEAEQALVVQSPRQQAQALQQTVRDLVRSGELHRGQGRSMTRLLAFRRENPGSAARVRVFLRRVDRLEARGQLSPDAAAELRTAGETLLQSLTTATRRGQGRGRR